MLAAPALESAPIRGPRPLDPRRDSEQVFKLLDAAFGPLIDYRGRRLFLNQTTYQPGAPVWAGFGRRKAGRVPGFVWEEDGQLLGTVSVMESILPGRFLVANVAVHWKHRRMGVARALMEETIKYTSREGAKEIMLQVREDNEAAIGLYRALRFQHLGRISQWDASTSRIQPVGGTGSNPITVRRMPAAAWRVAYDLDRKALADQLNWPVPPTSEKYRTGFWKRISGFLNGRRVETWLAQYNSDQKAPYLGLVSICHEWARPLQMELRVPEPWRSEVTQPLLNHAIVKLQKHRATTVRIDNQADDEIGSELLKEANFRIRRTLSVMRLDIGDHL